MRKICFVTGSRADYGIMAPLMRMVADSEKSVLQVIATNMHLSPNYGMTVNEIIADGFKVDERVESLLASDSASSTVKTMGLTLIGMADAFERLRPDIAVVLGDRYEMLAAASAAAIFRIPIAHLHGGETTEGAYDDCIRHAITKLSWLHFASTEQYARRIIAMGEAPERVFHVGAPGVDNIRKSEILSKEELERQIGFNLGNRYIVATYHPVTLHPGEEKKETSEFLAALEWAIGRGWKVLITLPNSDTGGIAVSDAIKKWATKHPGMVKAVASLGRIKFYSALAYSSAMTGNSSSGLIEAPSFGVPTLNVGDRQKGRASGESVLHVASGKESVTAGLDRILSGEFREKAKSAPNPYEKEGTLETIFDKLLNAPLGGEKSFYDK